MNILTITASLLLPVWSLQAIADDEHVSIIPPGETFPTTPEEIAKRSFLVDDEDEFKENISPRFRRSTSTFGGSNYTRREQKKLLKVYNYLRRQVFPSASDMNELLWNFKLAAQAQTWSDGCYYEHPDKFEHPDYRTIGQTLYIKWLDEGGNNPPTVAEPVERWYSEGTDYSYPMNNCRSGAVCGHYKQVVWAETRKVGCGITFCKPALDNSGRRYENAWLVTCNYSPPGNVIGQRPYLDGEHCTACMSGFCRNGLCSNCRNGDRGCECNLICQNCGILNRKRCECNCRPGFNRGSTCQKECRDANLRCGANPGWPPFWCHESRYSFVKEYCPAMCGLCGLYSFLLYHALTLWTEKKSLTQKYEKYESGDRVFNR